MRGVRGAEIALIFQEPMTALNPVFTHRRSDRGDAARARPRDAARRAREGDRAARRGAHPGPASRVRRLPAPAVRRHAAARADRDGAGVPAVAGHRRRADDRARRHDSGADPRPAARDEGGASTCRCCSSRTTSASSPKRPTASPSCTPDGSSKRRRSRELFRRSAHPYTRGLLASMPGGAPGHAAARDRGHGAAARRTAAGLRVQPALPDRFEPCTSAPPQRLSRRTDADREVLSARSRHVKSYLDSDAVEPDVRDARSLMPLVEVSHLVKHFTRDARAASAPARASRRSTT